MKRLLELYKKEAIPSLTSQFGYPNVMAVPRIEKVVVNVGFGKHIAGKGADERRKIAEVILADLAIITGQRPVLTKAKTAIAGFKTRKGMPLGAKVTLRGKRMEEFLEKLMHVVLPRSRDFQGLEQKSVDEMGNLTIGIKEHIFFPEILPENIKTNFGLEVTVVSSAKSRQEGLALFKALGFPIK